MREIALHILDIAENGIAAGADTISILVNEARKDNLLKLEIKDNGRGIPSSIFKNVTDPFSTTRTTRRVGMGLSLLKAAALRCDGSFDIESEPGKGTKVNAGFRFDHIDRAPLGNMADSVMVLIAGHPDIDFIYTHIIDENDFVLDTSEIKKELEDIPITDSSIMLHLSELIKNALKDIELKGKMS